MRTLLATVVTIIIGACGPSSGMNGGGDDDDGDGSGGGDAAPPTSCSNASDCGGDQVCNPADNECASDVPCESAAQCGNGGVCNEAGSCEPNETGGECADDNNCLEGDTCNDGHCGCNGVAFQAMPVVPNMLIVLDRSGSMDEQGGTGGKKWDIARAALNQILDDHGNNVRFGLDMFASDNGCGAGDINVDIGPGTANAISSAFMSATAESGTPIYSTMNALRSYGGLKDTAHSNYVLLLTDGKEECSWSDPAAPVQQLRNQSPSVKTFVVGFGSGVNTAQLNDMATKGGTARAGSPKYYQANNATDLSNALAAILGTVLSCTYTLDQVPEDLDELYIYQDEVGIDRDTTHTDGWDYDPATCELTFYGAACDALESGEVSDLAIVYGCPGVEVE